MCFGAALCASVSGVCVCVFVCGLVCVVCEKARVLERERVCETESESERARVREREC